MRSWNGCIRTMRALAVLGCLGVVFWGAFSLQAQRRGAMESGSLGGRVLVSNGPKGPIQGGESAITHMILMADGWVYGGTEAVWGAQNSHLFRTDGEGVEHLLTVTGRIPGQTRVSGLAAGPGGTLLGATSASNEIFDRSPGQYDGGHLFSFEPGSGRFVDYGVISPGQGLNAMAVDLSRELVYVVSYPEGRLFRFDLKSRQKKDFGEVMKPWRVQDLGRVSWRGVPRVLMIDRQGTVYFSTYVNGKGGRIFKLAYGDSEPVFTGAVVPTQRGMDDDPIYENTIASAIEAPDGSFWCGSSVDGFLFKFNPANSTVVNKGKAFNYWNLRSLAWGGDGKLYMLGGWDEDYPWLNSYDPATGDLQSLGWASNSSQAATIVADQRGRILIGENMRNSFLWIYQASAAKP